MGKRHLKHKKQKLKEKCHKKKKARQTVRHAAEKGHKARKSTTTNKGTDPLMRQTLEKAKKTSIRLDNKRISAELRMKASKHIHRSKGKAKATSISQAKRHAKEAAKKKFREKC